MIETVLILLVILLTGSVALAVWAAERQAKRLADLVEDWCADVTRMAEERKSHE